MKINDALDDFILAAEADGLAEKTVKWYRYVVGSMAAAITPDLEEVTTKELRQYIADLRKRMKADSVASHVRGLHRFWNWTTEEYKLDSNPMKRIARHKQSKPAPKAVKLSDFVKMFNATKEGDDGARDRAILAFIADTGCRFAGLHTLKVQHLELDQRRAYVLEKGNEWRCVHFTDYTRILLQHWMWVRRSESDAVFTAYDGSELTEWGLREVFKRLKKRAGVTGRANPHAFRHGFAREYLLNGGDLATLSRLMGHRTVNTTVNHYAVFTDHELGEAHAKHSPVQKLFEGEKGGE
jgi:site-specific recombinase XerD